MCKIQSLRELVNQRLSSAVEEILGLFETTMAEYEEEIERQRRLLEAVEAAAEAPAPGSQAGTADVPGPLLIKQEVPSEQQESLPSVDQEDPEPPHIKEEQEEQWISQEGEQHQGQEEDDITTFTTVSVKSEDEEDDGQSSQLHQSHSEESGEPRACSSTQHKETDSDSETEYSDEAEQGTSENQPDASFLKDNEAHIIVEKCHCNVGKQTYRCSKCGKTFNVKSSVQRHMRSHTGEKPFSCSVCNKSFSQKKTLVTHLRTHTGEKPFSCSFCGKRFSENGTLKRHIRVHTGEKPYSCSVCGRNFRLLSHVKGHKCAGASSDK